MWGFIKKDLLIIKNNFKTFGTILIFYLLLACFGDTDITFLIPFFSVMIMISSFSYDNLNNFDAYAVTLPKGRENVVKGKYLTTLLLIVVSALVVGVFQVLIKYSSGKLDLVQLGLTMFLNCYVTLLLEIIMYPLIFKFGIEKARLLIFIVIIGIVLLGGLIIKFINLGKLAKVVSFVGDYWLIVVLLVILLGLFLISYFISRKVILKKEF